ncbi:hypothetical protein [Zoogloea sp.]|uniref:hypothetical protein n=1 Tax=Zoogloea sp. TaxID=49181 RepID=UPI0035B4DA2D
MLGPLEQLLRPALAAALPAGQDLLTGPAAAPRSGTGRVALHALRLEFDPPVGADDMPIRDPAFLGWQGTLAPRPGHPLDFPLPDAAPGELAEVHSPPGRVLAAGDAYLLDGRTLRFFQPPAGPVLARTRGARCAGYRERRSGWIDLELRVWTKDIAVADDLLARGLAAVLAALADINAIDLAGAPPRLALRLTKPQVSLAGIARGLDPAAPAWQLGVARCTLRGELELGLTLGTPAPEGRIGEVDVALHLPSKGA